MRKLKDESGQVLVVVALSMTTLLGFVAFATDVGLMLRQRRMAQTVADSAALAAATESLTEGTPSSVTTGMTTAATHDASMNGFTAGANSGSLNLLVGSNIEIPAYRSAGYVESVVSVTAHPVFMAMFGALIGHDYSSMNVTATAIASNAISSDGCMYVINDGNYDASDTVDMGGNSLIAAPNCGISVHGQIVTGGSASISGKYVSETYSPAPSGWIGGAPPAADPLSKLQQATNQPTVPSGTTAGGACTAPTGSGMSCIYDYNNGALSGTLQSNTIYYFDSNVNSGGGPTISGTVTGSNVTLYLAGNIPFDFSNNGSVSLTPPGYGSTCVGSLNPLCGILIDAPTDGSGGAGRYVCKSGKGNNQGNNGEMYFDFGSSTTVVDGIVYAPYMQMFGQDKGASTTFATDLVIGNICMQSSTFNVNGYSGAQSPLTRIGLVY